MLKAIKKTRIYEEVVSQIHELIREGKLKAGDQLPSERELAETFRVSRTSVREALRALETRGLVISRTGNGTFVADLPIESLVAPLARILIEEKGALADIFEVRTFFGYSYVRFPARHCARSGRRRTNSGKILWKTRGVSRDSGRLLEVCRRKHATVTPRYIGRTLRPGKGENPPAMLHRRQAMAMR